MTKEEIYKYLGYKGKYDDNVKKKLKKLLIKYHPDNNKKDKKTILILYEVKDELENGKVNKLDNINFDDENKNKEDNNKNNDLEEMTIYTYSENAEKLVNKYKKSLNKVEEDIDKLNKENYLLYLQKNDYSYKAGMLEIDIYIIEDKMNKLLKYSLIDVLILLIYIPLINLFGFKISLLSIINISIFIWFSYRYLKYKNKVEYLRCEMIDYLKLKEKYINNIGNVEKNIIKDKFIRNDLKNKIHFYGYYNQKYIDSKLYGKDIDNKDYKYSKYKK